MTQTLGSQPGPALPELDGDRLRGWSARRPYRVQRSVLARYAAVTRDPRPERLSGRIASPAYGVVPFSSLLTAAIEELAGGRRPDGLVHTHQRFSYLEPIRGDEEYVVSAWVGSLRSGAFGSILDLATRLARQDGSPVLEQLITVILVGHPCVNGFGGPAGDADPAPRRGPGPPGGPRFSAAVDLEADHSVAYAEVSGDDNPIHLDVAKARQAGFPAPIMHGMLTLALSANAIEARYPGAGPLRELSVEFTRPVFSADRLTVRWQEAPATSGTEVRFDVVNRRRRTVLRSGVLHLSPA